MRGSCLPPAREPQSWRHAGGSGRVSREPVLLIWGCHGRRGGDVETALNPQVVAALTFDAMIRGHVLVLPQLLSAASWVLGKIK